MSARTITPPITKTSPITKNSLQNACGDHTCTSGRYYNSETSTVIINGVEYDTEMCHSTQYLSEHICDKCCEKSTLDFKFDSEESNEEIINYTYNGIEFHGVITSKQEVKELFDIYDLSYELKDPNCFYSDF